MRYKDFVKYVASKNRVPDYVAKRWIKIILQGMRDVLLDGDILCIPTFGTLFPRYTKSRNKYDPVHKKYVLTKPIFKLDVKPSRKFSKILTKRLGEFIPDEFKEEFEEKQKQPPICCKENVSEVQTTYSTTDEDK